MNDQTKKIEDLEKQLLEARTTVKVLARLLRSQDSDRRREVRTLQGALTAKNAQLVALESAANRSWKEARGYFEKKLALVRSQDAAEVELWTDESFEDWESAATDSGMNGAANSAVSDHAEEYPFCPNADVPESEAGPL